MERSALIVASVVLFIVAIIAIVAELLTNSRIRDYNKQYLDVDIVAASAWQGDGPESGETRLKNVRNAFLLAILLNLLLAIPTAAVIYAASDSNMYLTAAYLFVALTLCLYWFILYYYAGKIGNNATETNGVIGQSQYLDVGHATLSLVNFNLLGMLFHCLLAAGVAIYANMNWTKDKEESASVLGGNRDQIRPRPSVWTRL